MALLWHTGVKIELGILDEMLYFCHIAAMVQLLGLLTLSPRLVVVGGLYNSLIGFPSWILDVVTTGTTTPSSTVLHLGTAAIGLAYARRFGVPRGLVPASIALTAGAMALARLLTRPELNVNTAFRPYPVWPAGTPLWASVLFNLGLCAAVISAGDWLCSRAWGRPNSPPPQATHA